MIYFYSKGKYVGSAYFARDGYTAPDARYSGGTIYYHAQGEQYERTLDLLRNEKPVYLSGCHILIVVNQMMVMHTFTRVVNLLVKRKHKFDWCMIRERVGIDYDQWLKSKIGTREYEERMEYLCQILKEYFEIETIEIHKRKFTARLNEKYYIKNFVNDDRHVGTVENGLNEILGVSDGHHIELPLIDIAAMISLGVKPKKIHRLIKKLYLIDVAYEAVSERIRDIWESYMDALELF